MAVLTELGLPMLDDNAIEELQYHMEIYNELSMENNQRINYDARKKMILTNTFDMLSGLFDLDFNMKLKFGDSNSSDEICLESINNKNYKELFYEMYYKCFCKYIENMHKLKNNTISSMGYYYCKLAYLTKDDLLLKSIIVASYNELLKNDGWLKLSSVQLPDIEKLNETKLINELIIKNKVRNQEIKETVMTYMPYDELCYSQVCNVFKCFSSEIFVTLTKKEKIHILNILYNYFTLDDKKSLSIKYNSIIRDNTSSQDCFKQLIDDLLLPGKTMLVMKRNKDMIADVLSWLPVIYSNETKKQQINTLDKLKTCLNFYKK